MTKQDKNRHLGPQSPDRRGLGLSYVYYPGIWKGVREMTKAQMQNGKSPKETMETVSTFLCQKGNLFHGFPLFTQGKESQKPNL